VVLRQVHLERQGPSLAVFTFAVLIQEEWEVEPSLMKGVEDHGLPDETLPPLPLPRVGGPNVWVPPHDRVRLEQLGRYLLRSILPRVRRGVRGRLCRLRHPGGGRPGLRS